MIKTINRFSFSYIVVIFAVLFGNCQGQSTNLKDCISSFNKAKTALNSYYQNCDTSLLQKSLDNTELAMKCDTIRKAAIELKISILMLLKRYKNGYEFVDSLSTKDFIVSYEKEISYYSFQAMNYESNGDTINRNKCFNDAIEYIQNYIQQERLPSGKLDERVYYDLFLMKWRILNKQELKTEIELAEQQHPDNKDFFESLLSTFVDGETPAEALQTPCIVKQ
jgi:tetratricopeptide (TPR) repeat protein